MIEEDALSKIKQLKKDRRLVSRKMKNVPYLSTKVNLEHEHATLTNLIQKLKNNLS